MSAVPTVFVDPAPDAPRLSSGPLYWIRLPSARAETLVRVEHLNPGPPPTAVVCVMEGDRAGETLILPSGTAMREDSGSFAEPDAAFPWF